MRFKDKDRWFAVNRDLRLIKITQFRSTERVIYVPVNRGTTYNLRNPRYSGVRNRSENENFRCRGSP